MNCLLWASVLLTSAASALAADPQPLSVGGVAPGMSEAQVVRLLGRPIRVERASGFVRRGLFYPNAWVGLDEDGLVAGVRSSAAGVCLGNGLCPGASAKAAYDKLPELRAGRQAMSTGGGCWAEEPISQRRVQAVELVCEP